MRSEACILMKRRVVMRGFKMSSLCYNKSCIYARRSDDALFNGTYVYSCGDTGGVIMLGAIQY